ncbi:hypothetical protein [Marinobacter sediminum]|nr:hypothetical protein [Marinobacter sediminum]
MSVPKTSAASPRGKVVATLALALLALGGNYLSLPLFSRRCLQWASGNQW